MTTFYVPVERRELPATNANRWLILVVDAALPSDAIVLAARTARTMHLRGFTTWAAVRYLPTFESMQALRDEMDEVRLMRLGFKAERSARVRTKMRTAGHLTSALFA